LVTPGDDSGAEGLAPTWPIGEVDAGCGCRPVLEAADEGDAVIRTAC
jgi:hypothetical protein